MLQAENKSVIKMTGSIDSFKRKNNLWKTQLMKRCTNQFPSVRSRADGSLDASVYILCIDKKVWRRFEDVQLTKFAVSFVTNPFQETDTSECAAVIRSVFKENITKL